MKDDTLLRYSRHILLPQVDIDGQEKILNSKVMIIGLGGLGSPVAIYLAAAGVGSLVLCDFDKVDSSNIHRQILHDSNSLGRNKVDSAFERLAEVNPDCQIRTINQPISVDILESELPIIDVVIDCTDNLDSRLLINQSCVHHHTALISGSAIRMEGHVAIFLNQGDGPCYQCLYADSETHQETCSETGVLSSTVGIIGSIQAQEALKLIVGMGTIIDGSLLLMDGMRSEWQKMAITKGSDCPICNNAISKGST